MNRDLKLVKAILLQLEKKEDFRFIKDEDFKIEGFDQRLVQYHLVILVEAGFIQGASSRRNGDHAIIDANPERLTWEGHEFLDAIRSPVIWRKVKNIGGQIAFDSIKKYAMSMSAMITDGLL